MAEPSRPRPLAIESMAPARVLVAEARFYDAIGTNLLDGAAAALKAAGVEVEVISVPGALELPVAVSLSLDAAVAKGRAFDAAVVLGCVIRGETYHFEIVSNESCRAVMDLSVARKLPLGNGILTVGSHEQAVERADPARGDKGGDAARAALALLRHKRAVEG